MESTTQNIGLTLYYDRKYQNYGSVQIDNLKLFSTNYRIRDMVFNATFNDNLVISRWSGLLWRTPEYLVKTVDLSHASH
jgi:hypothetical protein